MTAIRSQKDSDEAETENAKEVEDQERIEYECAPVDYVHPGKTLGIRLLAHGKKSQQYGANATCQCPALVERFGEEIRLRNTIRY